MIGHLLDVITVVPTERVTVLIYQSTRAATSWKLLRATLLNLCHKGLRSHTFKVALNPSKRILNSGKMPVL